MKMGSKALKSTSNLPCNVRVGKSRALYENSLEISTDSAIKNERLDERRTGRNKKVHDVV